MLQLKAVFLASCVFYVAMGSVSAAESVVNFGTGENQFSMTFVTIGDAGNPPDTSGTPRIAGGVRYPYAIGKFEVSREIITTANSAAGLGITLEDMSWAEGGTRPQLPATLTWNEAARFVNWLNQSQGYPMAYKFATQPGDPRYSANENLQLWTSADVGYDSFNRFRNTQARYVLPSIDEWYKAAFYDPEAGQGAGAYWDYPTGSNRTPTPVRRGTDAGTAVYLQNEQIGPADVEDAGGLSPYGVMGMGGNVWDMLETDESDNNGINDNPEGLRATRGGMWSTRRESDLSKQAAGKIGPRWESPELGFRVVSIPEPSLDGVFFSVTLSIVGMWLVRRCVSC